MNTKTQHTPFPQDETCPPFLNKDSMTHDCPFCGSKFTTETSLWSHNRREIDRFVNSEEKLLDFAKRHHKTCEDCEGTGKIYKHADPTTGQWVPCPIAEILGEDGAVRGGNSHELCQRATH